MKKSVHFCLVILLFGSAVLGQQAQNSGFEDWEDAGTVIDEPVNWSSIKTSDDPAISGLAPVIWGQSSDAHTGIYSVELSNVMSIVLVTGILTNGRVHAEINPDLGYIYTKADDDRWNTPFTHRPDSIAIWAKYWPQGNDTAQVKVLLHKGEGTLPPKPENQANRIGYAQINITGAVNNWTRFVMPFTYSSEEDPEYILIILTSGAGTQAVLDSKAWFDDIELIYGPNSISDLPPNEFQIYSSARTIYLDKVPQNYLKDSKIEIIDLNGSVLFSCFVVSDKINLDFYGITQGLYMIRLYNEEFQFSQKIHLN